MTERPSLSSCNYAESQDRMVTTTSDSMADAVTGLEVTDLHLGGSLLCTSGEGTGSPGSGVLLTVPPSFHLRWLGR